MLKKLSLKELICYAASTLVALIGFIFLILGIVADNLGVNNPLYKAQANFPWRYLGLILIGVAVIFAIIVLSLFAKKVDRVTDREARRKQRLSAMMSDIEKQEEIVVSDGKIVEENNKTEEKEPELETKPIESMASQKEEPIVNPTDKNNLGDK